MNCEKVKNCIVNWLCAYLERSGLEGFVVGVSGGIDSAVVSTLCALTGKSVTCVSMPINQEVLPRAEEHMEWLKKTYCNVKCITRDLSTTFNAFKGDSIYTELALANICSRLRMVMLYAIANNNDYLVVGTGNKVEDYGIGFFTKYGDGAIDISPIGDLMKSEVYKMGTYLKINPDILEAEPNDGLWDDGRTDEDQIGASYSELEWAMNFCDQICIETMEAFNKMKPLLLISGEQEAILKIYLERHEKNSHKMKMPQLFYV